MSTNIGGHVHTTEADLRDGRQRRRYHSEEFKARVVAECSRPGVSMAAIAMHYELNANLLRRWVTQSDGVRALAPEKSSAVLEAFVPLAIAANTETAASGSVGVEITRGTMTLKINWPMSASAELGTWLRELLR